MTHKHNEQNRSIAANSVLRRRFYAGGGSLVLRMKFSAKTPRQRTPPKR